MKYEIAVINITPLIEVYPPTNVRKNFVPTKFWQIFKLSPLPLLWGWAKTMTPVPESLLKLAQVFSCELCEIFKT